MSLEDRKKKILAEAEKGSKMLEELSKQRKVLDQEASRVSTTMVRLQGALAAINELIEDEKKLVVEEPKKEDKKDKK